MKCNRRHKASIITVPAYQRQDAAVGNRLMGGRWPSQAPANHDQVSTTHGLAGYIPSTTYKSFRAMGSLSTDETKLQANILQKEHPRFWRKLLDA
jgi:hypothetical protein